MNRQARRDVRLCSPAPWVLLGLLLLMSGCSHRQLQTTPPTTPTAPSSDRIHEVFAQRVPLDSVRGWFKARLETRDGTKRIRGALVVHGRYGLRVDLLSPLGLPVGYASLTPDGARIYLPIAKDAFFTTDEPEMLLSRLTGGSVQSWQVLSILLGAAPDCSPTGKVTSRDEDKVFLVSCSPNHAGEPLQLALAHDTLEVTGLSRSTEKRGAFVANFKDYHPYGATSLPRTISMSIRDGVSLSLQFDELEPNPEVGPSLFELTPPPHARILPMESLLSSKLF